MKNRKALGLLVALIVSVLCVSNAFAENASSNVVGTNSSRVTVGQNYYGDVLLGQIYQTNWNFGTKIKVINTSVGPRLQSNITTAQGVAVVAKVVIRSAACSNEVLDFLIYLTPSDMWEGEIRMNANGQPEIYSTDDSVLANNQFDWNGTAACNPFMGNWASEETPLVRTLANAPAGDTNTFGHIEVIGLAAYRATAPLSKDTLAMAYGNIPGVPAIPLAKLASCDFNFIDIVNGVQQDSTLKIALDVPNVLTGTLTMEDDNSKASINMTALNDWCGAPLTQHGVGALTGLNDASAWNTITEIEAALAKTEYVIPFDLSDTGDINSILINTLPTHYRRTNPLPITTLGSNMSSYFRTSGACSATALANMRYEVYDMEETPLIELFSPIRFGGTLSEVTMNDLSNNIAPMLAAGYTRGWVKANFPSVNTNVAPHFAADLVSLVSYSGAPSINSYITVDVDGNYDWNYAASPEQNITYINGTTATVVRQ